MSASPGRRIGPFAVDAEIERYGAGSLFRAREDGRPVLLVAVRGIQPADRAQRLARPADGYRLLPGDGPDRLWAVLETDDDERARQLLRDLGGSAPSAPATPQPRGVAGGGPEFEPPERAHAAASQPSTRTDAEPVRRSHTNLLVGLGVAVAGLVAVFVAVAVTLAGQGTAPTTGLPAPFPPPPTAGRHTAPPTPKPTQIRHPLPSHGPRPAAPMLSKVWQRGDPVYPMDLDGFTFAFRAPGRWGCIRSSNAGIRWVCRDETGLLGGTPPAHPSGGIIESDECSAPCGPHAYADVLARLKALGVDTAGLHRVNGRTRIDSGPDPRNHHRTEYRMSRVYDSNADGRLDRHLWVRVDANPADRRAVQKMLGDLYDATR